MSLMSRFLNVFRSKALEQELDDELRFHLEQRAADNRRRGMTSDEAESAAHEQFGDVARAKDEMQEVRMVNRQVAALGRNALAGVICWILGYGVVRLAQRVLGGWQVTDLGLLLVCAVGVFIALRLRARVMAYFLAAMSAVFVSEFAIHVYYGIRAAQGAPTHFAVMGAGILGVILGGLLAARGRGLATAPAGAVAESAAEPPSETSRAWTFPRRILAACAVGLALYVGAALMWRMTSFSTTAERPDPAFYRVGDEGISNPVLIHQVSPKYTPDAMRQKITGTVVMECIVALTGACVDVRVTESLDPGLDRGAVNALEQSRFQPGQRLNKPVPVLVTMKTSFSLR